MKRFINLLLSLIIIFSLQGCITRDRCAKLFPPSDSIKKDDSISYVERWHDSLIVIPADSSWLDALIICDSAGRAYLSEISTLKQGMRSKINASIANNRISIVATCDSASLFVRWKDRYLKEVSKTEHMKTVIVEATGLSAKAKAYLYGSWFLFILIAVTYFKYFRR